MRLRARSFAATAVSFVVITLAGRGALGAWVQFANETPTRLVASPSLGASDLEEKDFAWGDVDNDGDTDLVVVRKEPFTTPGRRVNVLLMNEGGVLVDRTATYAQRSDVPGDLGFLTPTNDRDVQIVDVDLDGWPDLVTAVTLSDGLSKTIGHPRIYHNLGLDPETLEWLGFRHEDARIPEMLSYSGLSGFHPRFCSVAVGDVTGDGYPDLWFGDYDSGGPGGFEQPAGADYNDRLLVNQGAANPGHFTDMTQARLLGSVPGIGQRFEVSAFGASGAIRDINGDGLNDIVKQTSLNAPLYVGVAYNDDNIQGFFDTFDLVNQQAPYFVSVGDLNHDDSLDMVVTDDGADRYLLNQDAPGPGVPDFISYVFSFSHAGGGGAANDDTFGSNSVIADLDNDGWNDVLIADVDVDVSGCSRRMHIYRNLGGTPGSFVTLQEQTEGLNCQTFFGNPSTCLVASIPSDQLRGVHDVAVFDIDGDGFRDLVVGRCSGTAVWMQLGQQAGPAGGVPDGAVVPGSPLTLNKAPSGRITLSWGPSCSSDDTDYAIYEGALGNFTSHAPKVCTTAGLTSRTLLPGAGDQYYLIVPTNGVNEGGAGQNSDGSPRPQGNGVCHPRSVGACGE